MNKKIFTPSAILPTYRILDGESIYIGYENFLCTEGKKTEIILDKYERNKEAREICLKKYGFSCTICSFNFEETFGEIGKGFIHVHHIVPLSSIGKEYVLNPFTDLIPVCPNCHSMLHKEIDGKYITIKELKSLIISK